MALWSRRLARLTGNASGAIYGTILTTALIAAGGGHLDPGRLAIGVLATLLVFWLAHGYVSVLEHGLHRRRLPAGAVREVLAREFVLVEAPALSMVALYLGAVGWLTEQRAITLALVNGVAQLVVWGIALGRRLGRPWHSAMLVGVATGGLGVVVVALEAVLH